MTGPFSYLKIVREASPNYGRVTTPERVAEILRPMVEGNATETMFCLCLDVKNEVNHLFQVASGGCEWVAVDMQALFKMALVSNASGIILAHNHPSGDTTPSGADYEITGRVREACKLLGLRFLDHVIITDTGHRSIAGGAL